MQWTDTRYLSEIKAAESDRRNIPREDKPHRLLMQQGECRHSTRGASSGLWSTVTGCCTSLPNSKGYGIELDVAVTL